MVAVGRERCRDVRDRPEQGERIILGRSETPSLPKPDCLVVDSSDHERTSPYELRGYHAPSQSMLDEPGSDATSAPTSVRRKLSQEQARHRVRRLAGPDRSWQRRGKNRGRSETVIGHDLMACMNHEHRREAFVLVEECAAFQPTVEDRLSAREGRHIVRCGERLGRREEHGSPLCGVTLLPWRWSTSNFDHLGDPRWRLGESLQKIGEATLTHHDQPTFEDHVLCCSHRGVADEVGSGASLQAGCTIDDGDICLRQAHRDRMFLASRRVRHLHRSSVTSRK